VLTRLVSKGVGVAPLLLHTGVASLEAREPPYAEYFRVSLPTAHRVNDTRRTGGRVIAIGTTVVRALESVVDEQGHVHPSEGWTATVVSPEHPVRSIDRFLTGWHEPEASHLAMLEAIAGWPLLKPPRRAGGGYLCTSSATCTSPCRERRRPSSNATPAAADAESPLQQLPTTRRAILNLLKR
jgi:S-adenosylmethionine:tRNA ribosyltransferase-isomerase